MRAELLGLLMLVAPGLGGCGSEDNVSLSGSISDISISAEQLTLGVRLTGGFNLRLELGAQAPEATSVSLASFALVARSDQSEVVTLEVLDPAGAFPLALQPGQTRSAELVLDDGNPVDAELASLCQMLRIAGAVSDDAANGRLTSIASADFLPGGC